MIEHYLRLLKNPEYVDGIPQTGTNLWELMQLVKAGYDFPKEEIPFIKSLTHGHYEQRCMAALLLKLIQGDRKEH